MEAVWWTEDKVNPLELLLSNPYLALITPPVIKDRGFLDITRPQAGDKTSHRQEIDPLDLLHLPITLPDLLWRQGSRF